MADQGDGRSADPVLLHREMATHDWIQTEERKQVRGHAAALHALGIVAGMEVQVAEVIERDAFEDGVLLDPVPVIEWGDA